jgi:hypothetical protein
MIDDDPMIPVDVGKLRRLVEKTPLTMPQFEQLIGWSFGMGEAPASKRRLAWDMLQLSEEHLLYFKRAQESRPTIWIMGVSQCGGSSDLEQ